MIGQNVRRPGRRNKWKSNSLGAHERMQEGPCVMASVCRMWAIFEYHNTNATNGTHMSTH